MIIDPVSGLGMIFGLLAWFRSEVGGRLSKDEILRRLECQDVIRDYLEWLSKKDRSQLLAEIENHKSELMDYMEKLVPSLESAFNTVLAEIYRNHKEVMAKLDTLSSDFLRVTVKDLFKPMPKVGNIPPFFRRPSFLLDAKNEVVPFHGRKQELENLHAWAHNESQLGIRIYTASGGMGKTRLLRQLCHELNAVGWVAGFLSEDIDDFTRREIRFLMTSPVPQLFVVDYPQEQTSSVEKLLESLSRLFQQSKIHRSRVILLVRETGDWWDYLTHKGSLRELLEPERGIVELPIQLGPLEPPTALAERRFVYTDAARQFAELLGQADPGLPKIELGDRIFDRVLLIHMAAYAAVCGRPLQAEDALWNFVVEREKTRIQETLQDAGLDPRTYNSVARQIMALITLVGGSSNAAVEQLSSRLSVLRDITSVQRRKVLDLLHTLYPGISDQEHHHIAAIEPDLLGEHFITSLGVEWQEALSVALSSTHIPFVTKALTHANRISRRSDEFTVAVEGELFRRFSKLGSMALEIAKAEPLPMAIILTQVAGKLSDLGDLGELGALEHALPSLTTELRTFAYLVTKAALQVLPAKDLANRSRLLNHLANRLSDIGQSHAALQPAQEAVNLNRALVERNRDAFLPALAGSLSNLSIRLGQLGHRDDEALEPAKEAVSLHRELEERNRDFFVPALATALNNLALRLHEVGQIDEALQASQETVKLRRELVEKNRIAFLPDLGSSLNNLSIMLSNFGQRGAALEPAREAADLYRELVGKNRDAFLPALGKSLNNLAVRLGDLGQRDTALQSTQEAVHIQRELVEKYRDAFLPDLAGSLTNLTNRLGDLGQHDAALQTSQEAVVLYRELAKKNRIAVLPDLAASLNNLANSHSNLEQRDAALQPAQEAVSLFRELAGENREAFLPGLAGSLTNLALNFRALRQGDAALQPAQEAVSFNRELVKKNREAFLPSVANSLNNLTLTLKMLGQSDMALQSIQEAVDLQRELALKNGNVFIPQLAKALGAMGSTFRSVGRMTEAKQSYEEAAVLLHPFFKKSPQAFFRLQEAFLHETFAILNNIDQQPSEDLLTIIDEFNRYLKRQV